LGLKGSISAIGLIADRNGAGIASLSSVREGALSVTGYVLLEDCRSPRPSVRREFCLGYIEGITDALIVTGAIAYCVEDRVELGQMADVVAKHLTENPKDRNQLAASLVITALKNAWPCSKP
jgi:hypothetical protein